MHGVHHFDIETVAPGYSVDLWVSPFPVSLAVVCLTYVGILKRLVLKFTLL